MFLVQAERCPSPRGQQGTGSSDFSWNFPAGCAERCLESCPCQCPVGAESHQTLALGFKNTKILQSSSNTSFPFKDRKEELSFLRPGPVSALGSGCPALAKPTGFIFQHRLKLLYSSSFPACERGVALAGAPDLKPQLRFWLPRRTEAACGLLFGMTHPTDRSVPRTSQRPQLAHVRGAVALLVEIPWAVPWFRTRCLLFPPGADRQKRAQCMALCSVCPHRAPLPSHPAW